MKAGKPPNGEILGRGYGCLRNLRTTLGLEVKVKIPLDNFCPVVFDSRGQCSSPFPSHRASVLSEDNLPWSHGQCDLDTERCYLPTEVVPIYLLAFACFRTARLAGAGTSDRRSLRRVDLILQLLGLLTLQHRLLQFSPQRHHLRPRCKVRHCLDVE